MLNYCVVPENTHKHTMEEIRQSGRVGGLGNSTAEGGTLTD